MGVKNKSNKRKLKEDSSVPKKLKKSINEPKENDEKNNEDSNLKNQMNSDDVEDLETSLQNISEQNKCEDEEEKEESENESDDSEEQDDNEENKDESVKKEENIKFGKDFKMKLFRQKLKGDSFITELRHFLYLANRNPKFTKKYIEKKGKPLELVEALDRIDKNQLFHISYVCNALQLVLMEILKNHNELMKESAVNASRYFMKNHSKVIEKLLLSGNYEHRKIIIKLLTVINCLETQLGKQLLQCFDSLTSTAVAATSKTKLLLWHSKDELKILQAESNSKNKNQHCNDDNNQDTVRKCFIHFILSYIIDGDSLLIKNLLDKYELINSILSGLIYDDHVTVCVVLKTMKKYILENTQITKTKKAYIFDIDNVKHLLKLYNWKGSNYFLHCQNVNLDNKKQKNQSNTTTDAAANNNDDDDDDDDDDVDINEELKKNDEDNDHDNEYVNEHEKYLVSETVHAFLIVLLTSRKYGLAFDAITNYRIKYNLLQSKCLPLIKKPWLNNLKSELIIKILKTCPELSKQTVKKYSKCLHVHRAGDDWVKISKFLQNLINELNPNEIFEQKKNFLNKITITDFSYWIKNICLPIDGLTYLKTKMILNHQNYEIRLNAIQLLYIMFKQHCNYMNLIINHEKLKGNYDLRKFKLDILDYVFVNFPTIENIVLSLYDTIKINEKELEKILKHLEIVLDLILLACKTYKSFVSKTMMIVNFLTLIRPLYETEIYQNKIENKSIESKIIITNDNEIKFKSSDILRIEMKVIKTILLLQPKSLLPGKELFVKVLTSFINTFIHSSYDDEQQYESGQLLKGIFMNSGLFENDIMAMNSIMMENKNDILSCKSFEIDLWLESLRYIDKNILDNVKKIFIINFKRKPDDLMKLSNNNVSKLTENLIDLNNKNINEYSNYDSENLQKLFKNIENDFIVTQEYIEQPILGKLLPLIIQNNTIENDIDIKDYLNIISLLLFYYIPQSYIIKNLFTKYNNIISKSIYKFMIQWIDLKCIGKLKFDSIPFLEDVYNSVINGKQNFFEIFKYISDKNDDKNIKFLCKIMNNDDEKQNVHNNIEEIEIYLNPILKNERLIVIYALQTIFIVSQLINNDNFNDDQIQMSCKHYIKNFLKILWYHKKCKNNKEISINYENDVITITSSNNQQNKSINNKINNFCSNQHEIQILSYYDYIIRYIYCSHLYLLKNFHIIPETKSQMNYLNFILEITKLINQLNELNSKNNDMDTFNFQEYTINFRKKSCNQIISSMMKQIESESESESEIKLKLNKKLLNDQNLEIEQKSSTENLIKILELFKLSNENCVDLLKNLVKLKSKQYLIRNSLNLNETKTSIYFDILVHCLNRLSELKEIKNLSPDIITAIAKIYIDLIKDTDINVNLEKFENFLYNFLNVYHFYIDCIPSDVLLMILKKNAKITKNTIRLGILLLERRKDLQKLFLSELNQDVINKKELCYPLLNVCCCCSEDDANDNKSEIYSIDQKLLQMIYNEYKNGIMKLIDKPQKSGIIYKENLYISEYLIDKCMPLSECYDFTLKRNFKFDTTINQIEIVQVKLIEKIFTKVIESKLLNINEKENIEMICEIFVNYLHIILQFYIVIFKREQHQHQQHQQQQQQQQQQQKQFDFNKFKFLSYTIFKWFENYSKYFQVENDDSRTEGMYEKILKSTIWHQFYKNCLKYGMQTKFDIDLHSNDNFNDKNNSEMLKIFAYLCDKFYKNYNEHLDNDNNEHNDGNEESNYQPSGNYNSISTTTDVDKEISQIFDMIVSHSKFFDIVLSHNTTSSSSSSSSSSFIEIKTQIMHLLLILIEKNPKILNKNHIPIYLGSYQAKLTQCDRYILAILQYYELNGIDMHEYRPFVWGEQAIVHYSLNKEQKNDNGELITVIKPTLQDKEPSILQIMSLIDSQISEYTLRNYPIWRKLNTIKQLPITKFYDPYMIKFNSIKNDDDNNVKYINDANNADDYVNDDNDENSNNNIYSDCYDPAFILPLMSMLFAPEIYSYPIRPVQNGMLGICFAALSCQDRNMRLAAGCIQLRYRQHFENHKFFDKPIWQQAYDNIQSGLNNLHISWIKHKKINESKCNCSSSIPRVPYISGLFLAKCINILIEPTNSLYKILTMFLRLKDNFNFLRVPEFNILFQNPDIEHQKYRKFILEVIRDGVKCNSDLVLLITTNTFKVILGYYGNVNVSSSFGTSVSSSLSSSSSSSLSSSLSSTTIITNLEINLLILEIINVCAKLSNTIKILIEKLGLLSWLDTIICNLEYYHFDTIDLIISIITNIWNSLKLNVKKFYNFQYIQMIIFNLMIKLSTFISGRLKKNNFMNFIYVLNSTSKNMKLHKNLTEENLNRIISCSQRYFSNYIWYLNNIKINGSNCIENEMKFCQRLQTNDFDFGGNNNYDDDGNIDNEINLDNISKLGLINLRQFIIEWIRN